MSFKKVAIAESLGVIKTENSWHRTAKSKISSYYTDNDNAIDVEAALDSVADMYLISRDPRDYIFIPARANSADRPNNNLDGWELSELQRFDDVIATNIYKTYNLKPHFVNHNSANPKLSRGVILDSHLNMQNDADDRVKIAVMEALGKDVDKDVFIETLVAVDTTKDPILAEAYKNGSVNKFSMGCDVTATQCSNCDNIATNDFQLCNCIKNKFTRLPVLCADKSTKRVAWEKCLGTVFQELSGVDDPADELANVQDGILKVANDIDKLGRSQLQEIANFVIRNANSIPDSLANIINDILRKQGDLNGNS